MFVAADYAGNRYCSFEEEEEVLRPLGLRDSLICPDCGSAVRFRAGTKTPHFYHRQACTNPNPYAEAESETHRRGKRLLYDWCKRLYPSSQVELEYTVAETRQRSDVMILHPTGERIAIEFQCARIPPEVWRERHRLYQDAGVIDIWVFNYGIGNDVSTERYRLINLEWTHLKVIKRLAYLNVADETVSLVVDGRIEGSMLIGAHYFADKLQNAYIQSQHMWLPAYQAYLDKLNRQQQLADELAREEERRRVEQKEKQAEEHKEHLRSVYRGILQERMDLTKGMTKKEIWLFNRLREKLQITDENFPGICHLSVEDEELIRTPKQLWQLWVCDDLLSRCSYFIKQKKTPILWIPHTVERFKKLRADGYLRIAFNDKVDVNYVFTLYSYVSKLNYIGILESLGGSLKNKRQRLTVDRFPRLSTHKENALLSMYYSGYKKNNTEIGESYQRELRTIQEQCYRLIYGAQSTKPREDKPAPTPPKIPFGVSEAIIRGHANILTKIYASLRIRPD